MLARVRAPPPTPRASRFRQARPRGVPPASLLRGVRAPTSCALDAAGHVAVVGGYDGPWVDVCDARSGAVLRRFAKHRGWVTAVALSADGLVAASIAAGGSGVFVWNTETLEVLHEGGLSGRVAGPHDAVKLSADGRFLVVAYGAEDGIRVEVRRWKGGVGAYVLKKAHAFPGRCAGLAVSDACDRFAVVSDGWARSPLDALQSAQPLAHVMSYVFGAPPPHSSRRTATVYVVDADGGRVCEINERVGRLPAVVLSGDGTRLVVMDNSGIEVCTLGKEGIVSSYTLYSFNVFDRVACNPSSIALSGDGMRLVAPRGCKLHVWLLGEKSGRAVAALNQTPSHLGRICALSSNASFTLSASPFAMAPGSHIPDGVVSWNLVENDAGKQAP